MTPEATERFKPYELLTYIDRFKQAALHDLVTVTTDLSTSSHAIFNRIKRRNHTDTQPEKLWEAEGGLMAKYLLDRALRTLEDDKVISFDKTNYTTKIGTTGFATWCDRNRE